MHARDIGLLDACDLTIAARAEAAGEVLISKDEDVVVLRLPDRFARPWLRCGHATNRALTAWPEPRWMAIVARSENGERFVDVR